MNFPSASRRLFRRTITTAADANAISYSRDFTLWPNFFPPSEQRILLATALRHLDSTETKRVRRRRESYISTLGSSVINPTSPQALFLPDEYYDFHKGHYDEVIRHYREMHLTSWGEADVKGLTPVLNRLRSLYPTQNTQTHLLHLASYGDILPHIDNISASGSWIMGVSLGAERTLRMEGYSTRHGILDVKLPSGSVYLQKDTIRYEYKHSIPQNDLPSSNNEKLDQRLSIIVRDIPP